MVKRLMIIIGIVAVVLVFIFVLMNQGAPETPEVNSEDLGALRVAVHDDLPKMGYHQYLDQPLEGLEIDLSGQLAKEIYGDEKLVDLKASSMRTALVLLKNKEVDCVIATQVKPEKSSDYLYSNGYYTDPVQVLYQNGEHADLHSFGEGQTIGVLTGSAAATMLEKQLSEAKSKAKIVYLESYPDAKEWLSTGKIDGFCGAKIFLQDMSNFSSFQIGIVDYVVVVRKEDEKLLERIQQALGTIQGNGTLDQLKQKWQ